MVIVLLVLMVALLAVNVVTLYQVRALLAPRQHLLTLQEVINLTVAMSDQMTAKHHLPRERRLMEAMAYARELCDDLGMKVKDATLRKTIEATLKRR
jgi:hypothetical protein